MRRTLAELTNVEHPAWPGLHDRIASAHVPVQILDADRCRADETLVALDVTTGSTLGALAYHSGGLILDHGWLRVLGGGTTQLPSLATANGLTSTDGVSQPPPWLIVAFDVLGGRFAIDGGGLGFTPGHVCYWGVDSLAWQGLGIGHTAFIDAFLHGAGTEFFASLRWEGWQGDVATLSPDEGMSMMPPPFTAEGADTEAATRRPVPFAELLAFYDDMARQLRDTPAGSPFQFKVTD